MSVSAFHVSAIPQSPCEEADSAGGLAAERAAHVPYLLHFRTAVCPLFAAAAASSSTSSPVPGCPLTASACFHCHSRLPRRRRPTLLCSRFNYLPTRCRHVTRSAGGGGGGADSWEADCPQGVHCRFAHSTEEMIYHPSKYKTQRCQHRLDASGQCRYGPHCAKAHSASDLRLALFEAAEEPHRMATAESPAALASCSSARLQQFACPAAELSAEHRYFAYRYKTRRCSGFPFSCACGGLDFHREEERRRGPLVLYAPLACPNVKPSAQSEWGSPAVDCSGRHRPLVLTASGQWRPQACESWECELAHSQLELMYHPALYKTSQCLRFDERDARRWRCLWRRRCAHAHGRRDCRSRQQALEEWKEHIAAHLPPQAARQTAHRLLSMQTNSLSACSANGVQSAAGAAGAQPQHSASSPLPVTAADCWQWQGGDAQLAVRRLSAYGGGEGAPGSGQHVRSVSQPVELMTRRGDSGSASPAWTAPRTTGPHLAGTDSLSTQALPPACTSPSLAQGTRGRLTVPLAPDSAPAAAPASTLPLAATPLSASASSSLSLFTLRPDSGLWASPHAAQVLDDCALQAGRGWSSERGEQQPQQHRRSLTVGDAVICHRTALAPQPLPPLASEPFASCPPQLSASESVSFSSSSPSPSHLVPRHLLSSAASLSSSGGSSPSSSAAGAERAGAASVSKDERLSGLLLCPFSSSVSVHWLRRPVTLPCCGLALCQSCLLQHYCLAVRDATCRCGHRHSEQQRSSLPSLPVNPLLDAIAAIVASAAHTEPTEPQQAVES